MLARAMSFAWYRFRTTVRSERSYYISVILLVGALGGLSMGAFAAARSTESSFSDLVASSHVPDLFILDGVINPAIGLNSAYNPALLRKLSHLPHVERVADTLELNLGPLTPKGKPLPASLSIPADASVNGLYFTEDPAAITQGRMADPHKAGEVVIDAATAKAFGYHLGEEIPIGWLTNAQASSGNLALNSAIPADQRTRVTLVGIAGAQATNLFEDQDEAQGQSIVLFTPALTNKLLACCSNTMLSALTLQGGNRYLSAGGGRDQARAAQGLPLRLRPGQRSRRHRQRHLAARGHRAGRLRRHRRRGRPSHRGSGDQPPDPPESGRPRHHPGPRGEPLHDLLRRPDRHARRGGGRLRPGRGWWPSACRRWHRWDRCGRSCASGCMQTGR